MISPTCTSSSAPSTKTRVRDSSAALTSNEGFSVVAPIRVMTPSSTKGSTASCWPLLKRWISSMKRIVFVPDCARRSLASSMFRRRSATPALTALRGTKCDDVTRAINRASVVLPLPGGPHRIIEPTRSSSMARRSSCSGPTRCSWPTNSSRVRGRMRAASGWSLAMGSSGAGNSVSCAIS